jgi:predicted dehydrogenase
MTKPTQAAASRRDFLKTSAAGVAASAFLAANVHAAGSSDAIRVGLIGCGSPRGGRGRGAAEQCLNAGKEVKLVAMADAFKDHLDFTRDYLKKKFPSTDKFDVPEDRSFVGLDAYQKLCALKDVDLVLLAAPPGFRPAHIQAAVAAGKHIFAEKPVAVDAPGVRAVLKACEEAKQKKLNVVSGLCWRYDFGMRATFDNIHNGGIGDIVAMQCTYNTGGLWNIPRQKEWSDVEAQMRNWLYFTWLSGDHNVEQHIHSLDKMAWAMKDQHPIKAVGLGGRQSRTSDDYGHIFDHHSVVYEYANGVKLFSNCRQQNNTSGDVSDHIFGTKGVCDVFKHSVKGEKPWKYSAKGIKDPGMYQNEHNELIAALKEGKVINNGEYMSHSTMMAIMGRMATYTGQAITWDKAMNSQEVLMPEKLEFGSKETPAVARPGFTKFI